MPDFIPRNSNQSVINLNYSISDYWNLKRDDFCQQLSKLSPKELVGIRNTNLETELKNEIRKYLEIETRSDNDNIIFGFGSYSIMEKLAWKLLPKGLMIGEFPQFRYFPMEYLLAGGSYCGFWRKDFTFPFQEIKKQLNQDSELKVVYINNPNNPTGNVVPNKYLLDIVQTAADKKILTIVDEVYADLLPVTNSVSGLVNRFDNLLVLRSFSKTFGIQNLRLGYLIAGKKLMKKYKQICNWNEASNMAVLLSLMMLRDNNYLKVLKKNTRIIKKSLTKLIINQNFKIMPTSPLVPLMFIKSKKNIDLEDFFANKNIIVKGGKKFSVLYKNFPKNFCRIRIPVNKDEFNKLKNRLLYENAK